MLEPALVLPKPLRQATQDVALAEELDQVLQIRKLVWQLCERHASHIQHLQVLEG